MNAGRTLNTGTAYRRGALHGSGAGTLHGPACCSSLTA